MNEALKLFKQIKTKQQGEEILGGLTAGGAGGLSAGIVEQLQKLFYGAKYVSLTLAFYPTEKALDKIIDWFEANLGERPILDLTVDPGIIGGAKVLCNEHFKDYSVRSRLEKLGLIGEPLSEDEAVGEVNVTI